jgi:branched-chain amino acid transport system ATP-binding protein
LLSEVLLRTDQLRREFSGFVAVDGVDFSVRRGELRAVIGPNGAGKTTFFRVISGELRPSAGHVWFEGRDISGISAHKACRLGIGKSYQITNTFANLTVFENVKIAAQPPRVDFAFLSTYDRFRTLNDRAAAILETVGLLRYGNLLAAHLSYGKRRHLELGMALASEPTLLLLDEPTAGMTPEETDASIELIRRIAASRTVIVVEHKMKVVMAISDRITVFHQGRILAEGTPEEVRSNAQVQSVYLGDNDAGT